MNTTTDRNKFDCDLKFGQAGERWFQWLGTEGSKVEVKRDDKWRTTGNLFFEFECNGIPSGYARTEAAWFVVVLAAEGGNAGALIFRTELLKKNLERMVERKNARVVSQCGDGGRVRGILVPVMFVQFLLLP